MTVTRESAVQFTMGVLRNASDWEQAQDALAQHPHFRPWIDQEAGGDDSEAISVAQSIVSEAEDRLAAEALGLING